MNVDQHRHNFQPTLIFNNTEVRYHVPVSPQLEVDCSTTAHAVTERWSGHGMYATSAGSIVFVAKNGGSPGLARAMTFCTGERRQYVSRYPESDEIHRTRQIIHKTGSVLRAHFMTHISVDPRARCLSLCFSTTHVPLSTSSGRFPLFSIS